MDEPAAQTQQARRKARAIVLFALLLVALSMLRIIATYQSTAITTDEPFHLYEGIIWLQFGEKANYLQPPLAQVIVAALPYLNGVRARGVRNDPVDSGWQLLATSPPNTIELARLGVTFSFGLGSMLFFFWVRRFYGATSALLALFFYLSTPSILSHAGIAMQDYQATAVIVPAFWALMLWLEHATALRSVALGATLTLVLLTKFNAAVFFLVGALAFVLLRLFYQPKLLTHCHKRVGSFLPSLLIVLVVAISTLWAGYGFSFASLETITPGVTHRAAQQLSMLPWPWTYLVTTFLNTPVPAPEFLNGLRLLSNLENISFHSYLLGEKSLTGFRLFFPMAFLYKTTVPLLLLTVIGSLVSIRQSIHTRNEIIALPAVVFFLGFLPLISSHFNIGHRHILPLYPFACVLAAIAITTFWKMPRFSRLLRCAILALVFWHGLEGLRVHPRYLAYFNQLAGDRPEQVLVNADLDMGQDVLRLRDELQKRNIKNIHLAVHYHPKPHALAQISYSPQLNLRTLKPHEPRTGWIAIGVDHLYRIDGYQWLKAHTPITRVGDSIFLFYIPITE